jgi:hypothetical protein
MKALKRPGAGGFGQARPFPGQGGQGVIDFLRANEAQLAAMRAAKPSLGPAPEASPSLSCAVARSKRAALPPVCPAPAGVQWPCTFSETVQGGMLRFVCKCGVNPNLLALLSVKVLILSSPIGCRGTSGAWRRKHGGASS